MQLSIAPASRSVRCAGSIDGDRPRRAKEFASRWLEGPSIKQPDTAATTQLRAQRPCLPRHVAALRVVPEGEAMGHAWVERDVGRDAGCGLVCKDALDFVVQAVAEQPGVG